MSKNIYLAGKIAHHDWRHDVVKNLSRTLQGGCVEIHDKPDQWPVLQDTVWGFNYVGPFFVADDHGCFHGENSHGVGADHDEYLGATPDDTLRWCMDAISRTDIFFAWIECTTCYGTLAEIGYAKALGKTIWIAGKRDLVSSAESPLWFAIKMADLILSEDWLTPEVALRMLISKYEYDNQQKLNQKARDK